MNGDDSAMSEVTEAGRADEVGDDSHVEYY